MITKCIWCGENPIKVKKNLLCSKCYYQLRTYGKLKDIPQKGNFICNNCGVEKEKIHFLRSKQRKIGIKPLCKKCNNLKEEAKRNQKPKCILCDRPAVRNGYCSKEYQSKKYFKLSKDGIELRRCIVCKKFKPISKEYFYPNKKNLTGFRSRCIKCDLEQSIERSKTDHARKLRSHYRRVRNRENEKKQRKAYLPRRRIVEKKRRKTDINFALKNRMRCLMHSSLKSTKNGQKWQDLTGYSVDRLKKHLEKQFVDGMTWERFLNGEIHIDHKIPISAFNFSSPEDTDFKRCYALKNLQPLWKTDNLKKSDKIEKPFQPTLF